MSLKLLCRILNSLISEQRRKYEGKKCLTTLLQGRKKTYAENDLHITYINGVIFIYKEYFNVFEP